MNQPSPLAPELGDPLEWINAEPIRLRECGGRVVVLAFFNQASAYCHNLLESLHHLALKHPQQLQVIGIHVPKYPVEREAGRVAEGVSRLGIRFPVASDPDYVAWQHYGIHGWPSLVLIDAGGRQRQVLAGEVAASLIEDTLQPLIDEAPMALDGGPASIPGRRTPGTGALHHPAGIAIGPERMYIADAGHHQVLECNLQGRVLTRYGTGHAELVDGSPEECAFDAPHGLLLHREALYVADTGNHALRRINLRTGQVETLAGTGRPGTLQGHRIDTPREADLNRPWGLALDGERLYISLAGQNQVWAWEMATGALVHIAGSGQFGHSDGSARSARMAHPTGLAALQNTLYILESGSATLRRLSFNDGQLRTLVGSGVFEYGREDGPRERASLTCPQGLALQVDSPVLWLADAGNDLLRTMRLGGGSVATARLEHTLNRPEAIATGEGAVWLVNTDAHQVLRMDLGTGEVNEVEVVDAQA